MQLFNTRALFSLEFEYKNLEYSSIEKNEMKMCVEAASLYPFVPVCVCVMSAHVCSLQ